MQIIERLQAEYCGEASREARREAGQFFTPRWVATGLAKWVISCNPDEVFDPAAGFGILLDECRRQSYRGRLRGCEVDPVVAQRAASVYAGNPPIEIDCRNFLNSPPTEIHSAVVNPPYNRFQNRDLPARMMLELSRLLGITASGYTNQYALFLYMVLGRLRKGGRAAFIVPSEFLATGYGVQVKEFLIKNRRLRHLVLFDTQDRIFADAATTACVLLFDGQEQSELNVWHLDGESDAHQFAAICSEKLDSVNRPTTLAYSSLISRANWQGLGRPQPDTSHSVPLSTYGDVKRGIATGANEFFLLKPSEAALHGLTGKALQPCIASASSVQGLVFESFDWDALIAADRQCYLLDGVAGCGDAVERYLLGGEAQGYDRRYLTRMRKPWFKLEARRPATLLLAVFGRSGFQVSLNTTSAVNLTAFHGFYPNAQSVHLVPLLWLYFQTTTASAVYLASQRAYGDGLKKLEPGDWSKLWVPNWFAWTKADLSLAQHWATEALEAASQRKNIRPWCIQLDEALARCSESEAGVQESDETQLVLI